jgi:hypothetical protein
LANGELEGFFRICAPGTIADDGELEILRFVFERLRCPGFRGWECLGVVAQFAGMARGACR